MSAEFTRRQDDQCQLDKQFLTSKIIANKKITTPEPLLIKSFEIQ